jgi:hypothetical protein
MEGTRGLGQEVGDRRNTGTNPAGAILTGEGPIIELDPAGKRTTSRWLLPAALVLAASFYRPMIFWAQNAWDLSSPNKILAVGAVVGVLGLLVLWLLARLGIERRAAALGVATGILILTEWEKADNVPVFLKILVPVVVAWIGHRLSRSKLLEVVAVVAVAVFGVAPLVQLVMAHIDQAQPYPLKELAGAGLAEPTGLVEDVVVVIVDSYPSLYVAREWQGHDTVFLEHELSDLGFEIPDAAWSQLTFTALSVPSILELQPVVTEGPIEPWGNVSSANQIIRGDNLVANTLQNAGFSYTHIESGADPLACGGLVDSCAESTWVDEPVWELLRTTVVARWMEEHLGLYTVAGTLNAADNLVQVGDDLIGNGEHDYVFAHFFLPHIPVVVDAECAVLDTGPLFEPSSDTGRSDTVFLDAFSEQLKCADDLVTRIAGIAGPSTAILITADHGTGFGGQVGRDGRTWTDADIAERLGIMLAYHLPAGCEPPVDIINVDVMRAIMDCAVEMELPARNPEIFLGADNPVEVPPDRMASIRAQVEAGTLQPSSS